MTWAGARNGKPLRVRPGWASGLADSGSQLAVATEALNPHPAASQAPVDATLEAG
jgi:hypothetical protein